MICRRCGKSTPGLPCLSCGYDGGSLDRPQSHGPPVERHRGSPNFNDLVDHAFRTEETVVTEARTETAIATLPEPAAPAPSLPPVPPKPTGGGKQAGNKNLVIGLYYDEHRKQIESEAVVDLKAMRERWHISTGSWTGLKRRWAARDAGTTLDNHKRPKPKTPTAAAPAAPAPAAPDAVLARLDKIEKKLDEIDQTIGALWPSSGPTMGRELKVDIIEALMNTAPAGQQGLRDRAQRILEVAQVLAEL